MIYQFITNCVSANGDDINEMCDMASSRELTGPYFMKQLGAGGNGYAIAAANMIGYESVKQLLDDWHVRFHSSHYQGLPCLYIVHSGIEYVYLDQGDVDRVLSNQDRSDRHFSLLRLTEEFDEIIAEAEEKPKPNYFALAYEFYFANKPEMDDKRLRIASLIQSHVEPDLKSAVIRLDRVNDKGVGLRSGKSSLGRGCDFEP